MNGLKNRIATAALIFVSAQSGATLLVDHSQNIWTVSRKQAQKLKLSVKPSDFVESLGMGTTAPLPSLDGLKVALVIQGDAWVYDVKNKSTRQVTQVSPDAKKGQPRDNVLLTAWVSADQLIYYLNYGESVGPDEEIIAHKNPKSEYGHYLLDIKTKTSKKIEFSGVVAGVFPNGELLIERQGVLIRMPVGATDGKMVTEESPMFHSKLNAQGTEIVAVSQSAQSLPLEKKTNNVSRVVRINVQDGAIQPVSDYGSFGEYQHPVFSADGKSIAYTQTTVTQKGKDFKEKHRLIVDRKEITQCTQFGALQWVADDALAYLCEEGPSVWLKVTSVKSKKNLFKTKVSR